MIQLLAFLFLGLLMSITTPVLHAEDLTLTDGTVYKNITVTKADPDGLRFVFPFWKERHPATARLPAFSSLLAIPSLTWCSSTPPPAPFSQTVLRAKTTSVRNTCFTIFPTW